MNPFALMRLGWTYSYTLIKPKATVLRTQGFRSVTSFLKPCMTTPALAICVNDPPVLIGRKLDLTLYHAQPDASENSEGHPSNQRTRIC
jgi:hypothetical protein